jgi:signal transduction histidine kinase
MRRIMDHFFFGLAMRPPRGFTLSLRHLLIVLTAIGLLPLAALGAWSVHAAGAYHQREQERALLDLARALSSAVDAELDGTVATLSSMARTPAVDAGDMHAFYDTVVDQVHTQPEWLGVNLADADGRMLWRSYAAYGAAPAPVADPDSLHQVLALRRPVVGRIARGKGGQAAVPVRIPLADRAGHQYALTAVIRPDRILRVILRQQVPPGSIISVLDASGTVVARSLNHAHTVAGQPSAMLARRIRSGQPEAVAVAVTLEGETVLSAYTKLSRYGWTVAVGAPPAAWAAAPTRSFLVYGIGILLSLALSIGLASLLARRIVRHIGALQRGAAALGAAPSADAKADADAIAAALPVSHVREIGAMAAALRAAAGQRAAHEAERARLLASLEDALAQARQAGRAKDEFLAVLGHELRNPLSPIVGALDLMDLRDEAANRRERGIMRRQVSHLKHLVDDLLDVSRIAAGKLRLDVGPVNLADLARHAVAARPDQPVRLRVADAAPAHGIWVHGDEHRLNQVLGNLLSNAARFGSTATDVTLDVVDRAARLTVDDNGIGMTPDLAARVFEPFYQAPQQLARGTGGLGLGLAIVHRIVELHGGAITARSAGPGRGSRFEVTLPLGAAPHDDTAPAPAAHAQPLRVLLVDDNEDAATLTAAVLRRYGHEVRTAHTAAGALALVAAWVPQVALLDIGLPDMDGHALAVALRTAVGSSLRLVALSGYGKLPDVTAADFDLYLTKPASTEDLQRALQVTADA